VGLNAYQGLGLLEICKKRKINYHIICLEKDSIYNNLKDGGEKIFCLEEKTDIRRVPRNTGHLLARKETVKYIKSQTGNQKPLVVFFKPSAKISFVCKKYHWLAVGNNPKLAEFLENKLSFYTWATKNRFPLVPGKISIFNINLLSREKLPFIIQFKRGWAGKSSFIIRSEKDVEKLKRFSGQKVKVSPFLEGKTFINNGCVLKNGQVLISPPGKQISGIKSLSNNPLSTTGRQWPAKIRNEEEREIGRIANKLGSLIYKEGYRGFFGADFLITKDKKIFLLECNPRLTASFVFYTQLEKQSGVEPLLWHHLDTFASFTGQKNIDYQPNISGSEIIQRNNQKKPLRLVADIPSGHLNSKGEVIDKSLGPKNDPLLVCRPSGSIVQKGDEIFKIISRQLLVDQSNNLLPEINKLRYLTLLKLASEQKN
jgi:carbamoylphosphate synthase large subunit